MKILMVVSWYSPRGSEVLTDGVFHYEQSMALKKYCDTAVYFPFDHSIGGGFSSAVEKDLQVFRTDTSGGGKIGHIKQYFADFKKICEEFKPDILHAHVAGAAGVIAVMLGKHFHIPVVITEHNPIELYGLDNKVMRLKTGWAYKNSLRNVCVSGDSAKRLGEIFPAVKYEVIYNGIMDPSTMELESHNYMAEGRTNLSIVAGFYSDTIKGYQYLLPAIKELKDKGLRLMLHIVGGGTFLEMYQKMAEKLDITDCVTFYGVCDRKKVYTILSQVDFSVSSSIFECSGVSVQEAMLLGKPLVVSRSGGANSLVTEDTAIVVDRESTEALVNGIEEMIINLAKYDSEKIKVYAYENFEIDNVSRRYMKLYNEVLNR